RLAVRRGVVCGIADPGHLRPWGSAAQCEASVSGVRAGYGAAAVDEHLDAWGRGGAVAVRSDDRAGLARLADRAKTAEHGGHARASAAGRYSLYAVRRTGRGVPQDRV